MPQRGYDLQPNVAASATLGNGEENNSQPQRGCVICIGEIRSSRNRVAVESSKSQPRWGKKLSARRHLYSK